MSQFTSILVREWGSRNMREISISEYNEAEKKAGKNSAFAETRGVIFDRVDNTKTWSGEPMTVEKYLAYRNS